MQPIERARQQDNQILTYPECFQKERRSFSRAADLWMDQRARVMVPFSDQETTRTIREAVHRGVNDFDRRILSDYFDVLSPHFARASGVICWSSGHVDTQRNKIGVVRQVLEEKHDSLRGRVAEIVDEDKLNRSGRIFMIAQALGKKEFGGGQPPMAIVEDKMTNITGLMEKLAVEGDFSSHAGVFKNKIKEEYLDRDYFPFEKWLEQWQRFVGERKYLFEGMKFLYIPPDKPVALGRGNILYVSPRRAERIKRLIATTNAVLGQERFFHIEDTPNMESVIDDRALVVTDVDGPLVSQQRVLDTREEMLRSRMIAVLDNVFRHRLAMGFSDFARLVSVSESGYFHQDYDEKGENYNIVPGLPGEKDRRQRYIIVDLNKEAGTVRILIKDYGFEENDGSVEFVVNQDNFKKGLESLGIN